jgi:hypothetical protein
VISSYGDWKRWWFTRENQDFGKTGITNKVSQNILHDILYTAVDNVEVRLHKCVRNAGEDVRYDILNDIQ